MADQPRIDEAAVEFAENPEPRCPCVLLLDTSGSMAGEPITHLNEGLVAFQKDLARDGLASRRVEVAIVTFDSEVRVVQDFVTAGEFTPVALTAQGQTHTGEGMLKALSMMEERKAAYKANGVSYYRPWIFMITDGEPQGDPPGLVAQAAARVKQAEQGKHVAFFAVGVQGANLAKLAQLVTRTPVMLQGLNFVEMFIWLSRSTTAVSHSEEGDQVALPPPGWGTV